MDDQELPPRIELCSASGKSNDEFVDNTEGWEEVVSSVATACCVALPSTCVDTRPDVVDLGNVVLVEFNSAEADVDCKFKSPLA